MIDPKYILIGHRCTLHCITNYTYDVVITNIDGDRIWGFFYDNNVRRQSKQYVTLSNCEHIVYDDELTIGETR